METDFSKIRWLKDVDKAFLNKVKTIYFFGTLAFMITEDDDCFSIGKNIRGLLGIGSDEPEQVLTPQRIPSLCQKRIKNFSRGDCHVVGLTENGTLYTWGENNYGQLGLGHEDDIYGPVMVQGCLSGKHIIQASCGFDHRLILTSNGEVFATGRNSSGQLGIGTTNDQCSFVQITNGIETLKIIQISCGDCHSAAVSSTGEIFLWGGNYYGQLGTGNKNNQLTPCKLNLPNPIKKVALGYFYTLALTENGILYAWGRNIVGQLGIKNDTECLEEPIRTCEELGVILDIYAFDDLSCCKTVTNAYVWGKCNGKKQMSPRISPFTDLMQAALNAEGVRNFHPIIIAMKRTLMDILGISIVCSDNTTVDEDSVNTDKTNAWKSHLELRPIRLLGEGAFGKVWKAQHNETKRLCAIKRISLDKACIKMGDLDKVFREVQVQEKVEHECIVEFKSFWLENKVKEIQRHEVILEESGTSTTPIENHFLLIQMELCDGDLTRLLKSKEFPSVAIVEVSELFKQLVTGLEMIHKLGIIHRDLKPANIFFKKFENRLVWKIGDFGLAFEPTDRPSEVQSFVGTNCYKSPEMQKGIRYTNKTDIYSLGVVFFQTLLRIQNITNVNTRTILCNIQTTAPNRRIIKQYLSKMSYHDKFEDLLVRMLNPNPANRPTAIEIASYIPVDLKKCKIL